jgi:import inner membrane translocase subunit TIM23
MRTDGDKMLYGTGTAYMGGLLTGGTYGFVKGLQHPNATTFKLKINSVLNMCTRYGPWAGNNSGVMGWYLTYDFSAFDYVVDICFVLPAIIYTSLDSMLGKYRDVQDYSNHIAAAFTTGAIFKSTGVFPLLSGMILSVS